MTDRKISLLNNSNYDDKSIDFKTKKNDISQEAVSKGNAGDDSNDSFIKNIEEIKVQLKEMKSTLDQHLFLDQIIPLLNQLNDGEQFNRVLLMHILDFGSINKEEPINLNEFFKVYFNVYDSMKANRTTLLKDLTEASQKLEIVQKKSLKYKGEIILDNGLTSHSVFKFFLSKLEIPSDNKGDKMKIIFENIQKSDSTSVNIDESSLRRKNKLKISENENLICTMSILKFEEKSNMWTKCIEDSFTNTALDNYSVCSYKIGNIEIELKYILIQSKLNFYQRKLSEVEYSIEEMKNTIEVMNKSLSSLEKLFPKVFSGSKNKSQNEQEADVSEKIEQVVLNLVGKNIILWEKFTFIINKCLLIACLILMILFRPDFLTLTFSSILIGLEYGIVKKNNYFLLFKGLLCSISFDLVWSLYYIYHYRSMTLLEGDYSGGTFRKFTTILSVFVIIMKLILLIAIWRLTQLQKYNQMNPESKSDNQREIKEEIAPPTHKKSKNSNRYGSTFTRPSIKKDKSALEANVGLRDTDLIDKV